MAKSFIGELSAFLGVWFYDEIYYIPIEISTVLMLRNIQIHADY